MTDDVAAVFESYDGAVRSELCRLRSLIFQTAAETAGVGAIEETLRWGQPSYVTTESGSGSTIRLAPTRPGSAHDYGLFFTCHTNLVTSFKSLFGDALNYDGERSLLFTIGENPPENEIRTCIAMALRYHLDKRP